MITTQPTCTPGRPDRVQSGRSGCSHQYTYTHTLTHFFTEHSLFSHSIHHPPTHPLGHSLTHSLTLTAGQSRHETAHLALQAALIEYNLDAVDAAINAVREALASGLDWRELGQMIKAERRAGNPVAGLIDSLALDKNKITVVLENSLDEEEADDEAMTRPATKVGSVQTPTTPGLPLSAGSCHDA